MSRNLLLGLAAGLAVSALSVSAAQAALFEDNFNDADALTGGTYAWTGQTVPVGASIVEAAGKLTITAGGTTPNRQYMGTRSIDISSLFAPTPSPITVKFTGITYNVLTPTTMNFDFWLGSAVPTESSAPDMVGFQVRFNAGNPVDGSIRIASKINGPTSGEAYTTGSVTSNYAAFADLTGLSDVELIITATGATVNVTTANGVQTLVKPFNGLRADLVTVNAVNNPWTVADWDNDPTAYMGFRMQGMAGDSISIDSMSITVPEPASLGLLGVAGLGMLRRRRMA